MFYILSKMDAQNLQNASKMLKVIEYRNAVILMLLLLFREKRLTLGSLFVQGGLKSLISAFVPD